MLQQTTHFELGHTIQTHFIRHFLILKQSKSRHTAISYERDILDFFQTSQIEEITLQAVIAVTFVHVEHYLLDMRGRGLASSTINRKLSSLSALYKWLLKFQNNEKRQYIIQYNPFANLKEEKPTVNYTEAAFLTQAECVQLLNSFDEENLLDLRNKAILSLALTTALRKSELINIQFKHLTTYGAFNVIEVTRKGNKKGRAKLQPEVLALLQRYIEKTNRDLNVDHNAYLFIGHSRNKQNKEKLDPSTLNYMMKAVCKKAGITKPLRVHSTRHTAITLAISNGASIEKVRDFAAHQNINTTNRYVHSLNELEDHASDVISLF